MGFNNTVIQGVAEDRCHRIIIEKPKGSTPTISFIEQRLIHIGDTVIEQMRPGIYEQYDESKKFPILDPETDKPTGESASYATIFQLIKSAYVAAAQEGREQQAAAG